MRQGKYPFVIGFLIAPLALYGMFVLRPIAAAVQVSMTNWSGLSPNFDFVGLENFQKLLDDDKVWLAAKHHVFLLVTLPVITIALALFFAFLLNMGGGTRGGMMTGVWGSKFYRVVFFLPQVLAVVIVGVIFGRVYAPDGSGVLNRFLELFGVDAVQFMAEYGLWSILGVLVWQAVGFYVVLFAAGMSSIPAEIYEAAVMDGASRVTIFFRVTIPLLMETVKVAWVYLGILAMDAFALVMVLSIDEGGPDGATTVLPVQIYKSGIRESDYGYASALGVALAVFTIIFAVLSLRGGKRNAVEH
ncbi:MULTISPECIES: carbohydrate ABC transporter permease [Catellatospora]|uniref:Sugar ABC transporter permease n=2 Tax=Catellatospora TaxID=53365 RepID=A0A8J3PDJ0_9ACTN|nr:MULTISPECIES: sugar ABC transporter permease [Catellatospora]RKE06868.1 carbohydrate ABC transporter membrane protein 1 (CUT1 family) [Catellatospora citrea]GIF95015.1 sugar ABC transporter permease [Catellatospora citrea]GIG12724.1 sugar ABC transporter permease [Catellatospora methionotrophica]